MTVSDTHDYEPDYDTAPSPMSTDAPCRICGLARRDCERRLRVRAVTVTRVVPHHMRFSQPTRVTYAFPGYHDRSEKK